MNGGGLVAAAIWPMAARTSSAFMPPRMNLCSLSVSNGSMTASATSTVVEATTGIEPV